MASPSPISSSLLYDRSSLGVNTTNYLAICNNCGTASQNLKRCDSCKRAISKKAKYILNSPTPTSISQTTKSEDVGTPSPITSGVPRNAGATRVLRKRKALGTDCMPVTISANESFIQNKKGLLTPERLIAELERSEQKTELTGSIISFECRSIRVGSYKVVACESPSVNRVLFSSKGILFYIPHCVTNRSVKLVIPFETIKDVKFCNKKISMMFITTGPKHAVWMRKQLGMGNSPMDEHFFCPLNGSFVQKNIIILLESGIKELGRGILMRIFGKTMSELDYEKAHKMLVGANTIRKSPIKISIRHTPIMVPPAIVTTEVV